MRKNASTFEGRISGTVRAATRIAAFQFSTRDYNFDTRRTTAASDGFVIFVAFVSS
jgi:hypothetical protein